MGANEPVPLVLSLGVAEREAKLGVGVSVVCVIEAEAEVVAVPVLEKEGVQVEERERVPEWVREGLVLSTVLPLSDDVLETVADGLRTPLVEGEPVRVMEPVRLGTKDGVMEALLLPVGEGDTEALWVEL